MGSGRQNGDCDAVSVQADAAVHSGTSESVGGILDVPGLGAAHATDRVGVTGCTVIVAPAGAVAGVDVRGSAPGTRETDLLNPINLVQHAHAICLCGGSAFGLDAATGVMRLLAERGIGLSVGVGVVPIVPAAVLFDLAVAPTDSPIPAHPTAAMGYAAAEAALGVAEAIAADDQGARGSGGGHGLDLALSGAPLPEGNVGAGCGATVGKALGMQRAMKAGIGSASRTLPGGLIVGAVVAVNAVGDVIDPVTGVQIAGPRDVGQEGPGQQAPGRLLNTVDCLVARDGLDITPGTNTTIAVVASNANLTKAEATKVAQMAHDGLARSIRPIHTMYDGDTVFALATGGVAASVDAVGAISAEVLAEAVVRAVKAAEGLPGLPSWRDVHVSPI